MNHQVEVAVGVIVKENHFFITQRHENAHQGGKWEFPGGKVEPNETVPEALLRELKEEIDITILACEPLMTIEHDYGDKRVKLSVFIVDQFLGEPSALEGQNEQWVTFDRLKTLTFPEANQAIIERLAATSFG